MQATGDRKKLFTLIDGQLYSPSPLKWVEVGSSFALGSGSEVPDTDEFSFKVVKTGVNAGDYREVTVRKVPGTDHVDIIATGEIVELPPRELRGEEIKIFARFKQLSEAEQHQLVDLALRQHTRFGGMKVKSYDGMAQTLIRDGYLDVSERES
jgi:hypothetical protein